MMYHSGTFLCYDGSNISGACRSGIRTLEVFVRVSLVHLLFGNVSESGKSKSPLTGGVLGAFTSLRVRDSLSLLSSRPGTGKS